MKKLIYNNYTDKKRAVEVLTQHGIKTIANGWWGFILVKDKDEKHASDIAYPDDVKDCPELRKPEPFAEFFEMYYGGGNHLNLPEEIAIVLEENGWRNLLEYPSLVCQTDDLTLICIDEKEQRIKTINQLT